MSLEFLSHPITAISASVCVLAALFVIFKLAKQGFTINKHGLVKENREKELLTLRDQWSYIHSAIEGAFTNINHDDFDIYRTKLVLAKVEDVFQQATVQNSLSLDDSYVNIKYLDAYNKVLKYTEKEYFRSDDFKTFLRNLTREIIKNCIDIRKARA